MSDEDDDGLLQFEQKSKRDTNPCGGYDRKGRGNPRTEARKATDNESIESAVPVVSMPGVSRASR